MSKTLIGPVSQILPMDNMSLNGPLKDSHLSIIKNGAILIENGHILTLGSYEDLKNENAKKIFIEQPTVALPGFIDAHTHICFAGNRAQDFAKRIEGKSYLEIQREGGGILHTVKETRYATQEELTNSLLLRLDQELLQGVTTVEIKSGYGLNVSEELKILKAIQRASNEHYITCIPTCLAAHLLPADFTNTKEYLAFLLKELLPIVSKKKLAKRVDIFIEQGAFSATESFSYLKAAKNMGFEITVHADQFHVGGSIVAAQVKACSADHLEATTELEMAQLLQAEVVPVILPGASLGLGIPFAPARKLLDFGLPLAIASDWNPGTAPMGKLLTQAALLATYEKLSAAEIFAGLTYRAAKALRLVDRGILAPSLRADIVFFPTADYRQILYYQGALLPWKSMIKGEFCCVNIC
jgi:imidazolonepropionase